MKNALVLFPHNYSLGDNFSELLTVLGYKVTNIDFVNFFSPMQIRKNKLLLKLPQKYRWKIQQETNNKVNARYIEIFDEINPEIVLVYNEQKLNRETAAYFARKSKLVFYLGDHPLFIQNRPDNLSAILQGSLILCPDSYWMDQMRIIGAKDVRYFLPPYSPKLNFTKELTQEEKQRFGSDIVFVGRQYHDTFGYKRALFLNSFVGEDFKIYGDKSWYKWFAFFPELKNHFVLNSEFLPFEIVNTILNASKVYPVDANPGVINGVHVRIFDCIGSGILPVAEYRKDIETVFSEIDLPFIKNYMDSNKTVRFWVENESLRNSKINEAKAFVNENFSVRRKAIEFGNMIS